MGFGVQIGVLLAGIQDPTTNDPLASGKAYFYEPGTTTPKDVYSDQALTAAVANPYTLDSEGRALLFAQGAYRIQIRDSSGVTTHYDWDNLQYFPDEVQSLVSFTPTLSNVVGSPTATATYFRNSDNGMVDLYVNALFRASVAASAVNLTLPIAASGGTGIYEVQTAIVNAGATPSIVYYRIDAAGGTFEAYSTTYAWGTASANNRLYFKLRYPTA